MGRGDPRRQHPAGLSGTGRLAENPTGVRGGVPSQGGQGQRPWRGFGGKAPNPPYFATYPPSTHQHCPVTKLARAEARKRITSAISSGLP